MSGGGLYSASFSVCRIAWLRIQMFRTKRSPISSSKVEECALLLRIFLFYLFLFFLLPLMSTEDEGKLYGKYNSLQIDEKRVRPGFSWSHLAEISKSAFPQRKCSLFLCYWSVCCILPVENWVGGIKTTKRACELLAYCKPRMYRASSNPGVFPCGFTMLQKCWLF